MEDATKGLLLLLISINILGVQHAGLGLQHSQLVLYVWKILPIMLVAATFAQYMFHFYMYKFYIMV